jgi:hypothetical protein
VTADFLPSTSGIGDDGEIYACKDCPRGGRAGGENQCGSPARMTMARDFLGAMMRTGTCSSSGCKWRAREKNTTRFRGTEKPRAI